MSENWIQTQIKHLQRWRPLVLTHQTKNLETVDGISDYFARWEQLPALPRKLDSWLERQLHFYPSYYWNAKRRGARLFHAHYGTVGYHTLPLANATGAPLVTTFYGFDLSCLPANELIWREQYTILFQKGDLFLVEGPYMRGQLIALGCPSKKVKVHHLGVELTKYPYVARVAKRGAPLRVLAAGRFTEKKGLDDAVKAFGLFIAKGGSGILTLIGDAADTPEMQETKKRILIAIRESGVEESIHLRGLLPLDELAKAYYEHDIFLSPSFQAQSGDNEGGAPVSIIEAAATGMPVVATAHCDIPQVILHGQTGLISPERDVESLANGLFRLWEEPKLREAFGRAARKHIESDYDASLQADRLESHYNDLF